MKYRSVPYLRFKKFKEKWQLEILGNLGSVAMNKRIFKEETSEVGEVPFYKIGTFGGEPDSFITREKFEEYKSKYPYPEIGDVLISASGSIGRTVEYQGEEAYFQDSNIVWLKHDKRLDNSFLKQFYSIVKWQGVEGTTIKRLYNKNIIETPIPLPSISEQSAIGSLFRTLDDLLASYKDNLANYQSLKATMLSKMFPKAGQTVPEIRLDGFEDEWEIRKLSEISEVYDGTHQTPNYTESGVKFLSVENISTLESEKYISEEDFERDFRVFPEFGDILMTRIGSIGVPNIVTTNEKIAFYVSLALLKPKKRTNSLFVKSSIESNPFQEELWKKTLHIAFPKKINKNEISQSTIKCPSYEEQSAIGTYFSNLDNLITAHQEKISQLETLKKKLLQDMFI
ncbi:restriction endonuclease subunit S [Streptococcus gordonii]|jgi:type I restriction-modification system specificity subunit protein|uniref:restriction endonuclease subunit S n=1 Tax=Streptococcus gordonii TaxID=1302 RepID=UPI000779337B|nr:restriction endonuclease subunit S [Streptococcus gordonii]MCY7135986.1 restriction endonuclease subunit S [Streptococcus gordonii]